MCSAAGSNGDTEGHARNVVWFEIQCGECHNRCRSPGVEISSRFRTLDAVGLMQPLEHPINMLPEFLIGPSDAAHDVEFTL